MLSCLLKMDPADGMQYVTQYIETVDVLTDLESKHLKQLMSQTQEWANKGEKDKLSEAEDKQLRENNAALRSLTAEFKALHYEKSKHSVRSMNFKSIPHLLLFRE